MKPRAKNLRWIPVFAGMSAFLFFGTPQALAEPYIFSPEECEFEATLPAAPYVTQRCSAADPTQCHAVTAFTKVFDVTATINVYLTCGKMEEAMFDRYSGDIMRTMLIAMAGQDRLEKYETGFDENGKHKTAVILGEGKTGPNKDPMIYTAQIWVGQRSAFTIEAELIGPEMPEADKIYADILESVKPRPATDKKQEESKDGVSAETSQKEP